MASMRFFKNWGLVILWAGLIFYLSHIPSLNTGWGIWDFLFRKMAHVVEYGFLVVFLLRAWVKTWNVRQPKKVLLWCIFWACLYALSDEFHQSFVPGRGPSLIDVMIDSVGVVGGAFIFRMRKFESN